MPRRVPRLHPRHRPLQWLCQPPLPGPERNRENHRRPVRHVSHDRCPDLVQCEGVEQRHCISSPLVWSDKISLFACLVSVTAAPGTSCRARIGRIALTGPSIKWCEPWRWTTSRPLSYSNVLQTAGICRLVPPCMGPCPWFLTTAILAIFCTKGFVVLKVEKGKPWRTM